MQFESPKGSAVGGCGKRKARRTSRDILIVHVNPIERPDKPTSAREIMNRVDEISFNSSLMREMRAVAFITKLIDDGKLGERDLGAASKLNTDGVFLRELRALGSERARAWIDRHFDDLGSRSTIDIQAAYLKDTRLNAPFCNF
jgi:NTE family protein